MELYNTFDKANHLRPDFNREKFNSIEGWGLGWELIETMNIAKGFDHEIQLSKQLSPGQKVLYFFWYLDGQVTNGGFIQFYWNKKDRYLPPIIDGLKLIGHTEMMELVQLADKEFRNNLELFEVARKNDDYIKLCKDLPVFDGLNSRYYKMHTETMKRIENYARQNPHEFANLV